MARWAGHPEHRKHREPRGPEGLVAAAVWGLPQTRGGTPQKLPHRVLPQLCVGSASCQEQPQLLTGLKASCLLPEACLRALRAPSTPASLRDAREGEPGGKPSPSETGATGQFPSQPQPARTLLRGSPRCPQLHSEAASSAAHPHVATPPPASLASSFTPAPRDRLS